MKVRLAPLLVAVALLCVGAASSASAAALIPFPPASWSTGGSPIHAASPPNDPRLFVVQRSGVVRIVEGGAVRPTPFLTVPNIDATGERGLLAIAFPWEYATKGKFYVFASVGTGGSNTQTRILEYRVSATDPNLADETSARTVLTQTLTSATNHNGGGLAFGHDWKLYITIGDNTNAQAAQRIVDTPSGAPQHLGKVLRIDPSDPDGAGPLTYTVPADNPFAGSAVWALGLRNPYRAIFDPSGRLIIADVGEVDWEEVNIGAAGANYGWPSCEGVACDRGGTPSSTPTAPFYTYAREGGGCNSITGGLVVRDPRLVGLSGRYLYGDYCRTYLRTLDLTVAGGAMADAGLTVKGFSLYAFAEDARGCTYVIAEPDAGGGRTLNRLASSASDGLACGLTTYLPVPRDPSLPPEDEEPAPQQPQPQQPGTGPITTPTPNPTPSPGPAPTKPAVKPIRKNCVSDGAMSIAASNGRITSVKLLRGKKAKTLKLRRNGSRVELAGLPKGKVKLRLSVKTKRGKTAKVDKTYKPCA